MAAIVIAVLSAPATGESMDSACWRPGAAPGLFSWSAAPGIACRNGAAMGDLAPRAPLAAGSQAPIGTDATPDAPSHVTFSGTAHVGVAVTF